jgi:hypothetical protein
MIEHRSGRIGDVAGFDVFLSYAHADRARVLAMRW